MKYTSKIFLLILISLSSCTSMNKVVLLNNEKSEITTEAEPLKHKLVVGDVLHVKVVGIQEKAFELFNIETNANNTQATSANLYMNGFTIDSKGFIEIPTLGKIFIKGLTTEQAKDVIQLKADEFLINSTVILKHINFEITILGEVVRPGTFTVFKQNINIFEALGLAGDLSDYANRKRVKLIRDKKTIIIDLTNEDVLRSENYYLNPNDILYVEPASNVRLRSSNAQIYISAVSTLVLIANIAFGIFNSN
jgi:polysaccharide biosynthesis/export protein